MNNELLINELKRIADNLEKLNEANINSNAKTVVKLDEINASIKNISLKSGYGVEIDLTKFDIDIENLKMFVYPLLADKYKATLLNGIGITTIDNLKDAMTDSTKANRLFGYLTKNMDDNYKAMLKEKILIEKQKEVKEGTTI